ncbi:hypothetical protein AAFC00_001567 [Neodothiora populina]|uniref:NAD-dependent epimerase/dehydratase domain-containing protein n=1 Tax=Neodothiora populina TaxID=2781224 RepID=A0ABR3PPC2_9PEZI
MANHPSQQKILITGASGFVAAHVLNSFLKNGYHVRGTVRSEATAEAVRKSHARYADQLSFAIVPDISAPHAFDKAVVGVDGVIHTASPFQLNVEDNERDLLQPAIQGTTSILEAVAKHAPNVRRVVITSSFAAIIDMGKPNGGAGYTYTEEDWNPCTYEEAVKGSGPVAYCASKAFAERAAFDYVKEHKPKFDVVSINPPMVYGPLDHAVSDPKKLNTSSADIYRFLDGSSKEIGPTAFPAFADARDLGEAHLRGYEVPEAGNQRFAITSGNFTYNQVCEILREAYPNLADKIPDPSKEPAPTVDQLPHLSNERAKKVLGMTFRSLEECMKDTAESLLKIGNKQ